MSTREAVRVPINRPPVRRKAQARSTSGRPFRTPLLDAAVGDRRHVWSRSAYEKAVSIGFFDPDERVELIEGEIIEKMPQNPPHGTSITLCQERLREVFGRGVIIRVQQPLAVGEFSLPEPDIAVVKGSPRDYEDRHPTTALLVVEVSDTTLAYDRLKAGLYARAGVKEYAILNLTDRVLELHREPARMADEPYGHNYRSLTRLTEAETFAPLGSQGRSEHVSDLLPSRCASAHA